MNRRALLAAAITLMSAPAFGQSHQHVWIADTRTGCGMWSASPQRDGSVKWSAVCQSGLPAKPNILQWILDSRPYGNSDGEPREGSALSTVMSGHGVAAWANGDRYDGEWRDGQINGRGVAILANGNRYDGEWQNGLPNGHGSMMQANGESYDGVWVKGCYRDGTKRALFGVDQSSCQ